MTARAPRRARNSSPKPAELMDSEDPYFLAPVDPFADVVLRKAARVLDELNAEQQDDAEAWGWAA